MSAKPEILFLVHRIPYPPNKGDKIRSWWLLCHLAERFDVHLGCFVDDLDDWRHEKTVRAKCKSACFAKLDPLKARLRSAQGLVTGEPLTMPYYADGAMKKWVEETRKKDLAAEVAFSSSMAAYLQTPRDNRPRFVDLCDADSAKWAQYAANRSGPMAWVYGREGRRLAAAEQAIIGWADAAFAISADEAKVLDVDNANLHWFGNGVDTDFFNPTASFESVQNPADIVFVGAMDYWANVDAVQWFVSECWERIREVRADTSFAIVGARPGKEVTALSGRPGVTVTGRVEDVRAWLKQAKTVIAPMRIARGVQNKVLEAMAMSKAVVATTGAAEGIDVEYGVEIVIADDPDAYSRAVLELLDNQSRASGIGVKARARILSDYTWEKQLSRFDAVIDPLLNR